MHFAFFQHLFYTIIVYHSIFFFFLFTVNSGSLPYDNSQGGTTINTYQLGLEPNTNFLKLQGISQRII